MKYLGMTIHSIGVVIAGIWFGYTVFNSRWPEIDKYYKSNLNINIIENN